MNRTTVPLDGLRKSFYDLTVSVLDAKIHFVANSRVAGHTQSCVSDERWPYDHRLRISQLSRSKLTAPTSPTGTFSAKEYAPWQLPFLPVLTTMAGLGQISPRRLSLPP